MKFFSTTTGRLASLFAAGTFAFCMILVQIWRENNALLVKLYASLSYEKTFNERTILDLERRNLNDLLESYTTWDEMIQYIQHPTRQFETDNLRDELFSRLTDGCWVYTPDFRLVYHNMQRTGGPLNHLDPDMGMVKRLASRRFATHSFQRVGNDLIEWIVMGVFPSIDAGRRTPSRGVLVTVRWWNPALLTKLRSSIHAKAVIGFSPEISIPTDNDRLQGILVSGFPMLGENGEVVATLRTELQRESLVEMRDTYGNRFLVISIAAVFALLGVSSLIYRWVQRPIMQLRRSLIADDPEPIQELAKGAADFSVIARAVVQHFLQRHRLEEELIQREKIEAELREATMAAESASRAKSAFLATMSHEIRTPMNGVLGMSQLLLQEVTEPKAKGYAQAIQSSAESLLRTLNEVLDFSQIEAEKVMLAHEDFFVRFTFEDSCRLFAATAAQKGIELVSDVSPLMPPKVVGDSLRLRQVIMNLLGNAVKFTARGHVVLSVSPTLLDDQRIRIDFSVSDTGIGIESSRLERIFDMFTQADQTTSARYGGTGLGLSIARSLCQLMGGDLSASSEIGKGSVFSGWIIADQSDFRGIDRGAIPPKTAAVLERTQPSEDALVRLLNSFNWTVDTEIVEGRTYDWIFAEGTCLDPSALVGIKSTSPETQVILLRNLADPTPATWLPDGELLKPMRWYELALLVGVVVQPPQKAIQDDFQTVQKLLGLRVLVAEDTLVNQVFAQALLEDWGCIVTIVGTGGEAVRNASSADVILMDLKMPDMDGLEATRLIRAAESTRHVRIIAITANVTVEDRAACIAAGMDDFVAKPFRAEELAHAVAG
jgi:signal transduction histidine kinase